MTQKTTLLPSRMQMLSCLLYEGLVIFAVFLVAVWLPQTLLLGNRFVISGRGLWLHILLVFLIYFVWFWQHGGQTLPMKTWRLCLVGESTRRLRPLQAVLRYLAAWPSILFGVGILWMLFDKNRCYLHDRIAGTRIVREFVSPADADKLSPDADEKVG